MSENRDSKETFLQKATSHRWRLMYMLHLANTCYIALEFCMSFALVCMTSALGDDEGNTTSGQGFDQMNSTDISLNVTKTFYEFNWDSKLQGMIISSVVYLGFISPILGGWMTKYFTAKRIILVCMMAVGVISLLTPVLARTHVSLVIISRTVLGFFSTMVVPLCQVMVVNWGPTSEKVTMVGAYISGINSGSIISFLFSGFICTIPVDNGWPFIFYIFGGLCIIWSVAWIFCAYESPEKHPSISRRELEYIIKHRPVVHKENRKIPWWNILTSLPVLAINILVLCHIWTLSMVVNYLPRYINDVLKFQVEEVTGLCLCRRFDKYPLTFDLKKTREYLSKRRHKNKPNGIASSLPLVSRLFGVFFWAAISNTFLRFTSVTITRKLILTIGYTLAACATLGVTLCSSEQSSLVLGLFVVSTFCQVCGASVFPVNIIDIAPSYASLITGIVLGLSTISAVAAPMVTSYIVVDGTIDQWRTVLYMNIAIYILAVLIYWGLGSAEVQPWAVVSGEITLAPEANSVTVVSGEKTLAPEANSVTVVSGETTLAPDVNSKDSKLPPMAGKDNPCFVPQNIEDLVSDSSDHSYITKL